MLAHDVSSWRGKRACLHALRPGSVLRLCVRAVAHDVMRTITAKLRPYGPMLPKPQVED